MVKGRQRVSAPNGNRTQVARLSATRFNHSAIGSCQSAEENCIWLVMNDRKIERNNGRCFGRQQLLADSIENFISHLKKSDSSRPDIYKALKPFWLSNWVSIARVVAHVPQASLSRLPQTWKRPVFCARLSNPPKLCRSADPRAWPLILQSTPSIVFSSSLREWLPDDWHWSAGAWTWTQTWTLPPDQWVVEVLSALKPQNKVRGAWILFRTPKLRTVVGHYQPSSTGLLRWERASIAAAFQVCQTNELNKSWNQIFLIISKPVSLTNLQTAAGARCKGSFIACSFLLSYSFDCPPIILSWATWRL